ncbi:GNAT family N-acetyltransferase [Miniphocaeibacter massiliensis]|uniref:GNAT family N-acetyltransferase n=1 Tax=Miniphocaeibacter massiliensis TaxID=2041841 RepID=UPI000C1C0F82|nr:GNAT family N-acetyltransferase [Miniphocaeibacter massiliensis]
MEYSIRIAEVKDSGFLTEYRIKFLKLLGYEIPENKEEVYKKLKAQIERKLNDTLICIIAESNNRIVGTAYMTLEERLYHPEAANGKIANIVNVHTEEECRGNGIASKMIEKLIEKSKELGIEKITLDATAKGEPVYRKIGFKSKVDPILPTAMYYIV